MSRLYIVITTVFCLAGGACEKAHGDVTLVYGEIGEDGKPVSAQRIYLKDGFVAIETFGEPGVVVFDRENGTLRIVDHGSKKFFRLDPGTVARLSESLTFTQRSVLNTLEQKLAEMPEKERAGFAVIVDQLQRATASQLESNEEVRYQDTGRFETVGGRESRVFDAFVKDDRKASYFLVDRADLGMSEAEYRTLTEFQKSLTELSATVPGTLRTKFGDIEILAAENRLPVQVVRFENEKSVIAQRLLNHFDEPIDPAWFEVPDDFTEETLDPLLKKRNEKP